MRKLDFLKKAISECKCIDEIAGIHLPSFFRWEGDHDPCILVSEDAPKIILSVVHNHSTLENYELVPNSNYRFMDDYGEFFNNLC